MAQVITQYGDHDVPHVLEACERMEANLTAAVVSSDPLFINHVLANSVNGTTYVGLRARTTGEQCLWWWWRGRGRVVGSVWGDGGEGRRARRAAAHESLASLPLRGARMPGKNSVCRCLLFPHPDSAGDAVPQTMFLTPPPPLAP